MMERREMKFKFEICQNDNGWTVSLFETRDTLVGNFFVEQMTFNEESIEACIDRIYKYRGERVQEELDSQPVENKKRK
jgi:hypothetical protein